MDTVSEITLEAVIERYGVLLLDAYGVLVHSSGALPGVAELIERLNQLEKVYYILTNDASKLPPTAAKRYQGYGLALEPDRIITSGSLLKSHFVAHHLTGAPCAVLGPEDSAQDVEQAGGRIIPPTEAFDVLVIADESGFPFLETVDTALSMLFRALDRQQSVHLVLPNPDLIYPAAGLRGSALGAAVSP
jgi:ribonucleotide monophosphatase NagD (HAD superfamily)